MDTLRCHGAMKSAVSLRAVKSKVHTQNTHERELTPSGERLAFTMFKSRETTAASETDEKESKMRDFKDAKPGMFECKRM